MLHVTYLIILLPLIGFGVLLAAGRRLGDPAAGVVATCAVGASFLVSVGVYLALLQVNAPVRSSTQNLWTWIPVERSSISHIFLATSGNCWGRRSMSLKAVRFIRSFASAFSPRQFHSDSMSPKDPRLYLIHIRECCDRILIYTGGVESTWPSVQVLYDAVCRNLEIIGEASRRFDETFRSAHPEIRWRAMTNLRNILIHAYDRIAAEILIDIVRQDIPPLLASVKSLLGEGLE